MSDFEMLLTAWLNGGEIPADFKPTSRVEEYLLAILNGVDDNVDPKSRADVLLDAIATKYAGYADGIDDLRDTLGFTGHPVYDDATTPELIAAAQKAVNVVALIDLQTKGVTGVDNNTIALLDAYENLPSGGAELNIAYGNTAPEDTTKLWVKTAQPQNVTVDYDIDNGVESVQALTTVLPVELSGLGLSCSIGNKGYLFAAGSKHSIYTIDTDTMTITQISLSFYLDQTACGVVGNKIYCFGGARNYSVQNTICAFDTTTNALTTLSATLPTALNKIACAVVGTKCYLFGGGTNDGVDNTICVYDTDTDTLTTLPVILPTRARAIGCGVVGTKIYLFGGARSSGALNTINVFDTTTNTLTTLSATLPTVMGGVAVATIGTKCYLFGGSDASVYNTIYEFDTTTETLTALTETLPQTATGISCFVVGNECYLCGGWTGSANTKNINKFTVTFALNEGDIFIQESLTKNKFSLVKSPTEVKTGVSAVYVGNASNEAEYADALLYDGAAWQQIT